MVATTAFVAGSILVTVPRLGLRIHAAPSPVVTWVAPFPVSMNLTTLLVSGSILATTPFAPTAHAAFSPTATPTSGNSARIGIEDPVDGSMRHTDDGPLGGGAPTAHTEPSPAATDCEAPR